MHGDFCCSAASGWVRLQLLDESGHDAPARRPRSTSLKDINHWFHAHSFISYLATGGTGSGLAAKGPAQRRWYRNSRRHVRVGQDDHLGAEQDGAFGDSSGGVHSYGDTRRRPRSERRDGVFYTVKKGATTIGTGCPAAVTV